MNKEEKIWEISEEKLRKVICRINRKYTMRCILYHILIILFTFTVLCPYYILRGEVPLHMLFIDIIIFLFAFIYNMGEIINLLRSRNSHFYYKGDYICGVTLSTVFKKGEYVEIKCDEIEDFNYTMNFAEFVVDGKVYKFMYDYIGNFLFKNYAKQIIRVK